MRKSLPIHSSLEIALQSLPNRTITNQTMNLLTQQPSQILRLFPDQHFIIERSDFITQETPTFAPYTTNSYVILTNDSRPEYSSIAPTDIPSQESSPSFPVTTASLYVSTIMGGPSAGKADGPASVATTYAPKASAILEDGSIIFTDFNHLIRQISISPQYSALYVMTLAGTGEMGSLNSIGTYSSFNSPGGVAIDPSYNDIIVSDSNNNIIRRISSATLVTSTIAGNIEDIEGNSDGLSTFASFNGPKGIVIDSSGGIGRANLFIADTFNGLIRKLCLSSGNVTTVAGNRLAGRGYSDGVGTYAIFHLPYAIALDSAGNIVVADSVNSLIRLISATSGLVTTIAGDNGNAYTSISVFGLVDAQGTYAKFNNPRGVAVDVAGNIFVADYKNDVIRMISTDGMVSTVAGAGFNTSNSNSTTTTTSTAIDGLATFASFKLPCSVTMDRDNNVVILEYSYIRLLENYYPYSSPTAMPSESSPPTFLVPTNQPSLVPSAFPSLPMELPTAHPSDEPTLWPSQCPSSESTVSSRNPSVHKTRIPTQTPFRANQSSTSTTLPTVLSIDVSQTLKYQDSNNLTLLGVPIDQRFIAIMYSLSVMLASALSICIHTYRNRMVMTMATDPNCARISFFFVLKNISFAFLNICNVFLLLIVSHSNIFIATTTIAGQLISAVISLALIVWCVVKWKYFSFMLSDFPFHFLVGVLTLLRISLIILIPWRMDMVSSSQPLASDSASDSDFLSSKEELAIMINEGLHRPRVRYFCFCINFMFNTFLLAIAATLSSYSIAVRQGEGNGAYDFTVLTQVPLVFTGLIALHDFCNLFKLSNLRKYFSFLTFSKYNNDSQHSTDALNETEVDGNPIDTTGTFLDDTNADTNDEECAEGVQESGSRKKQFIVANKNKNNMRRNYYNTNKYTVRSSFALIKQVSKKFEVVNNNLPEDEASPIIKRPFFYMSWNDEDDEDV